MLTRERIKHITSLQVKKYRELHNEFVVEGVKAVNELINCIPQQICTIYCLKIWYENHQELLKFHNLSFTIIDDSELQRISNFKTPNEVLAVAKINSSTIDQIDLKTGITLMLDDIRDPGNMGTIIRTADWFGVDQIICSTSSVDIYNPKVIQASMGSVFRAKIMYTEIEEILKNAGNIPVLGAYMQGAAISDLKQSFPAIIVMGNESNGISENLEKYISQKISIPLFSKTNRLSLPESLNVAVATGIILNEFRK